MLGTLFFAMVLTYGTFALFHILGKVGNAVNSTSNKWEKDSPKLTIEDMCSPNNSLSDLYVYASDGSCSVRVSNKVIDKEETIFADNLINLRNKVGRRLRNYAALERDKNKEIVIL